MMKLVPIRLFCGLCVAVLLAFALSGCVFYNTFYNARKAFNEAEKSRKSAKSRRSRGGQGKYNLAIEKSLKVVENHPKSRWYDDALFILGVSYFYTEQYSRAERRFREILANYPDSKFGRESTVYLAKAKLEQDDMDDARQIFEQVFREDFPRDYKTEAALALGEYHFDSKQYDDAEGYFRAVRDSLGDAAQKKLAQRYIADAFFEQFRFNDALGAYLQILGMDPDKDEKYHALFQAAISSYRLQRIDDGLDYLQTLASDEVYFDSLGSLRLALAEGYEYDDELLQAELIYEQVASEATRSRDIAKANYYLGLMYQFDYDELVKAKEYYEKAVEAGRTTDFGKDALQRSSDIGKLSTYARTLEIDSTTTQEMIDQAAETQYNLAELYWFSLDKPDTAILELRYIVDSFSTSYLVPKAAIALSGMYKENLNDTLGADSILRQVLADYPRSDFLSEALAALGWLGTEADTGYAQVYMKRAEDALVDNDDYETARENYQYVVDSFPDSRHYLHARFNQIWLEETYASPGDSSILLAYTALADSFPGTEWATEATRRTKYTPQPVLKNEPQEKPTERDRGDSFDDGPGAKEDTTDTESDEYVDPQESLYRGPAGDTLILLDLQPTETEEEFEFPTQAYGIQKQDFYLYFQILLDFSGKVTDYVLKVRSENEEINTRASNTVASMWFDPLEISNRVVQYNLAPDESGGYWFVYKYLIQVPDYLR